MSDQKPVNCPENYEGVGDDRCFKCNITSSECPYTTKKEDKMSDTERKVREILEKCLILRDGDIVIIDNEKKTNAETELNALIESEKIRFAEECVPSEIELPVNPTETEIQSVFAHNLCRRAMLKNTRRAKGNKE